MIQGARRGVTMFLAGMEIGSRDGDGWIERDGALESASSGMIYFRVPDDREEMEL